MDKAVNIEVQIDAVILDMSIWLVTLIKFGLYLDLPSWLSSLGGHQPKRPLTLSAFNILGGRY